MRAAFFFIQKGSGQNMMSVGARKLTDSAKLSDFSFVQQNLIFWNDLEMCTKM